MTRKTTILTVVVDADLRMMVRTSLENGRRAIHDAETAIEGLHLSCQTRPDILLIDIGLPGHLNGFALCEAVSDAPAFRNTKVVVISGHGEAGDFDKARRCGVDAYLVKPLSPRVLVELVERLEGPLHAMPVVPAADRVADNIPAN